MYRRILAVALLLAGFWCLGQQEGRSQLIGEGVWKKAGAAAANNTVLDTGAVNGSGTAPCSLPAMTTTGAGLVLVFYEQNGSTLSMSVSGSTLGSFTQRGTNTSGSSGLGLFFKVSSGALVSETITLTAPGATGSYCEGTAFNVKNVLTGTNNGFDANGALPGQATANPVSITTSNGTDFLMVGSRNGGNAGVPAGPGTWIQIHAGGFLMTAYQKVTITQSAISVSDPSASNGIIGDALVSN